MDQRTFTWTTKGKPPVKALQIARDMTEDYTYNPGDGYPGGMLVYRIAAKVKGQAIIPKHPPLPPGVIP